MKPASQPITGCVREKAEFWSHGSWCLGSRTSSPGESLILRKTALSVPVDRVARLQLISITDGISQAWRNTLHIHLDEGYRHSWMHTEPAFTVASEREREKTCLLSQLIQPDKGFDISRV